MSYEDEDTCVRMELLYEEEDTCHMRTRIHVCVWSYYLEALLRMCVDPPWPTNSEKSVP